MTRLSFLSDAAARATAVCFVALAASASAAIGEFLHHQSLAAAGAVIAFTACGVLVLLLKTGLASKTNQDGAAIAGADPDVIDKIATVCSEISHGNFEARIARITETGRLGDVQHKVNDMIDRCDAFVREATACMEAVCRNVYYRTIMYGGLQGSFRVAAKIINDSVETQGHAVEKARQDAAAEQARIVDTLATGLWNLADGDLTFRLTDFPE